MKLQGKYEYIIDKTHPKANSRGSVYKHIVVAEEKLGRYLLPDETVHHKDLNKLNNDPDNIMVFATIGDHTRFHNNKCDESLLEINSNGSYICKELKHKCIDCGTDITMFGARCKSCSDKFKRKVERPSKSELFNILIEHNGNFTKVAYKFGVSDNAVRKWCDAYSIPRKSHDYKNGRIAQSG